MIPVHSVLIIDDDEGVREFIESILREQGVSRLVSVSSAEEAFEVLKQEPFGLMICDYKLGGMSGVAFMGKLRMTGDQTPILFITGYTEHKEEVLRASAQLNAGFLEKPFGVTTLMASIEKLLTAC